MAEASRAGSRGPPKAPGDGVSGTNRCSSPGSPHRRFGRPTCRRASRGRARRDRHRLGRRPAEPVAAQGLAVAVVDGATVLGTAAASPQDRCARRFRSMAPGPRGPRGRRRDRGRRDRPRSIGGRKNRAAGAARPRTRRWPRPSEARVCWLLRASAGPGNYSTLCGYRRQTSWSSVLADHHPYTPADVAALAAQAQAQNLVLVTTEKDASGSRACQESTPPWRCRFRSS